MHHLNIPDLTCGHCASTVENTVKSVDPDAKVAVDLDGKTASIESTATAEAFVAALKNAGYGSSLKKCCCHHVD